MSRNYLNAVKSGKTATPPPQPEKSLPPPESSSESAEDPIVDPPSYEPPPKIPRGFKKFTGPLFSRLEFEEVKDLPEKEEAFWRLFVITAGPAICNLGLTCTYFYDKLLSHDEYWELVEDQVPQSIKPVVNILVETSFIQNAGQEKILTLPITSLKQPYQKQNVVDYWMKILTKAEQDREKDKNKNLDANLNGGFNIETGTGKNAQTIVYLQDLSVVHSLLHAIGQLILNRQKLSFHSVKLPYRNGNIILSLNGRGGNNISIHVRSGKDNIKAIFPLEDFANQCRKAAKKFVSLVGYCHVYLRRPSNDSTEKENWILKELEHDCLNQDVIQIRNKLATGLVPGSSLPEHFQKKILISKKKQNQDQIENSDIMELILENLPENWKEAEIAVEHLLLAATEQRETERAERQARREREKFEFEKKRTEEMEKKTEEILGEEHEQQQIPAKKPKTKIKNLKGNDGWVTVTVVDEAGKELEKPKHEEKPVKPKKQPKQTEPTISNNIFTFADEMDNLPTPSDFQASLRERKLKGQPEPAQKPQKNKPTRKPVDKENGEKQVDIKKSGHKVKPKKKEGDNKKAPHPATRDLPLWQNDLFRPLVYVFAFVATISVLYLTLN